MSIRHLLCASLSSSWALSLSPLSSTNAAAVCLSCSICVSNCTMVLVKQVKKSHFLSTFCAFQLCQKNAASLSLSVSAPPPSSGVSMCTVVRGKQVNLVPSPSAQLVSIRQHKSAYVNIPSPPSGARAPAAYVRIREHRSAYVSIREHTSAYHLPPAQLALCPLPPPFCLPLPLPLPLPQPFCVSPRLCQYLY